jgi:hypothetical protein
MVIKNLTLEQIYNLEAENPPMIGNKSAVFSPLRKLAYHFLDLPYHMQMEIAQALGLLQDEDKDQLDAELFRRFFRRATESGKLSDLWNEVEKKHPDGEPDKNPFRAQNK